ncbi:MAG: protein adenylyltransferase SelO [Hyphomicrobiaceae bacterium]
MVELSADAMTESEPLFSFDNTFAGLPDRFFTRLSPTPVKAPRLIRINHTLARLLGLDPALLGSSKGVNVLAGNIVPKGSDPIAMVYAGHQFGGWAPQLGDGRAVLLGEIIGTDGVRRDMQLKGAGPTPYSRMGDGRAAIGPVLREYIVSEAMEALGVPTTRSLAVVATGEPVFRETAYPGAVLARVAESHVRVGTFQYFAARDDIDALRQLADYVIARHFPELASREKPYLALLDAVIGRQANLVAQWMGLGFIHGVMNTDNMSVVGETIDYGPCAFMDAFDPNKVFSSIDTLGRYSFRNQPRIAQWNLARFAQCLLPLMNQKTDSAVAEAQAAIDAYPARYQVAWLKVMRRKLGLAVEHDEDLDLVQDFLSLMAEVEADFTLAFRSLGGALDDKVDPKSNSCDILGSASEYAVWLKRWRDRLEIEGAASDSVVRKLNQANPLFVPRNHLIEEAIVAAQRDNLKTFEDLIAVLSRPFDDQPDNQRYAQPPLPEEVVHRTFCGT